MGAPSPCPVMPPRANDVCSVSRYWLDDIVVVQVCCKFRRTIFALRPGAGAGAPRAAAAGPAAAAVTNFLRFILLSSPTSFRVAQGQGTAGRIGHLWFAFQ